MVLKLGNIMKTNTAQHIAPWRISEGHSWIQKKKHPKEFFKIYQKELLEKLSRISKINLRRFFFFEGHYMEQFEDLQSNLHEKWQVHEVQNVVSLIPIIINECRQINNIFLISFNDFD